MIAESFELFRSSSPPLRGSYRHSTARKVVITLPPLGFQLHDLNDRSVETNWTLLSQSRNSSHHQLTVGAQFHQHASFPFIFAAVDLTTLLFWNPSALKLDDANVMRSDMSAYTQISASNPIFNIHTSPHSTDFLILSKYAQLYIVSPHLSKLESLTPSLDLKVLLKSDVSKKRETDEIIFSSMEWIGEQVMIIIITKQEDVNSKKEQKKNSKQEEKQSSYLLNLIHWKEGGVLESVATHTLSPDVQTESLTPPQLASCRFQPQSLLLSTLWSNGSWQVLRFKGGIGKGTRLELLRTTPEILFTRHLHANIKPGEVDSIWLTKSSLAMITWSQREKVWVPTLTLWETLYGTVEASRSLPPLPVEKKTSKTKKRKNSKPDDDVSTGPLQLEACWGQEELNQKDPRTLLVLLPYGVHVVTFTPPVSTSLLHAIGRLRESTEENTDDIKSTLEESKGLMPPFMASVNLKLSLLAPPLETVEGNKKDQKSDSKEKKGKKQETEDKKNDQTKEKKEKKRLRKPSGVVKKIESSKIRDLWQSALQQDADEREVFNSLFPAESKKKPSSQQFSRIFHQYVSKLETQVTKHRKRKKPDSSSRATVSPISQQLISQVTRHCLASDSLWDVLGWIIRSNSLSSKQCPHLISHLIKHEKLDLLESCLVNVHDLEEMELLRVLRYALNHLTPFYERQWDVFSELKNLRTKSQNRKKRRVTKTFLGKNKKRKTSEESDEGYEDMDLDIDYESVFTELPEHKDPKVQAAQNIMDVAISGGRNDPFLQQVLMTLNDDKLLTFLHYLHRWLQRYWIAGSARNRSQSTPSLPSASTISATTPHSPSPTGRQPTLAQVVDWASLLLDAHFPSLLAFPNRYRSNRFEWLLRHLRMLIDEKHILLCTHMETLRGFLDAWLKEKREEKSQKSKGRVPTPMMEEYSVEILTI